MEKTFKSLVLTSYILFLVWWFFPYIDPLLAVDPDQLYLWDSKGFDAKFQFPIWYEYLWLTYWTLAYAGLFFLHRPMRSVFLIGYIVAYIITPFHGTDIQSPWSSIVGDINTLLDGAILAIAFFTSISENFGSNSEKAEL